MATVAAAVIGFVVILGTGGQVSTGEGIDVSYVSGTESATPSGSSFVTCSIDVISPSEIDLQANGMIAGDSCYFEVDVVNAGPQDARLQRWESGLDPAQGLFRNLDGTSGGDFCGADVLGDGVPVTVGFQILADTAAVPGYVHRFDPAEEGLSFVRDDLYDGANCF